MGSSFVPRNGFFSSLLPSDFDLDEFGFLASPNAYRGTTPWISVRETENAVEVEAELPGVDEKDVEVALTEDVLTIKGRKLQHDASKTDYFYRQERVFGRFIRSVTLPFEPDPKTVKSYFANGVLTITIPKPVGVGAKMVKIPVKTMI